MMELCKRFSKNRGKIQGNEPAITCSKLTAETLEQGVILVGLSISGRKEIIFTSSYYFTLILTSFYVIFPVVQGNH